MKPLLVALLMFTLRLSGRGEDAPPWTVRVELQIVSVPMAHALQLVPRLRRPETFSAAEARVQQLLVGGQAALLGWPILRTVSGERAATFSVDEVIMSDEYGPPGPPHLFLHGPDPPTIFSIFYPKHTPPLATSTRTFGPELQVEAEIEPKTGVIDLKIGPVIDMITPLLTRLDALEPCIGARHQETSDRAQALPRSSKFTKQTSLSLPNDGRVLLGTSVEPQSPPRVVLFLLHAVAKPSPAP